jgi:hypothetical protein
MTMDGKGKRKYEEGFGYFPHALPLSGSPSPTFILSVKLKEKKKKNSMV